MKTRDVDSCVQLLKALGDQTRLKVIMALVRGAKHVGTINGSIGIEPSLLSHHLRVLKEAGLVRNRRDGKAVLYSLADTVRVAPSGDFLELGSIRLSLMPIRTPARVGDDGR